MEKYKVDKQGKLKIRDKKKIFKILRLIYDICSAIFILFVCVGLIISSSPRDDHNDSANQHIPNIQEKYRRNVVEGNGNKYIASYEILNHFDIVYNYLINEKGLSSGDTQYSPINYFVQSGNYLSLNYDGYSNYTINYFKIIYGSSHSTLDTILGYDSLFTLFFYPSGRTWYIEFKWQYNSTTLGFYRGACFCSSNDYYDATWNLYALSSDTIFSSICDAMEDSGYTEDDLQDSYNEGYSSGYDDGYDEGYIDGYEAGQENLAPIDSQLIISSDYDFRGLVTQEIDSATGLMRVSTSSEGLTEISYLDLKGLSFKIDNNVYNEVRIAYMSLDALNKVYDSVNMKYVGMQEYFGNDYVYYRGLVGAYYRYVENGTITRQVSIFNGYGVEFNDEEGTSVKGFNFTTAKWSNGVFRTITILSDSGQKQTTPSFSNSFTTYELLKLNGSQLIHIDNNVFNVFSLLTQAFNSVGGILSIAIIPGISIGLLMFIPLIVTIILFIIHMIKK